MEELMQYIWRFRLWTEPSFRTGDGRRVSVIDQGQLNTGAGPDFFNAKVCIDDEMWAGNIEIHVRASDWHRHGHDNDPAYNNVILHVVGVDDCRIVGPDGREIPQIVIKCSPTFGDSYRWMVSSPLTSPKCADYIKQMPSLLMCDWITSLGYERVQRKADDVLRLVEHYKGDWNEAIYVTLARGLGFGTNADAMEMTARSIPLKYLMKHSDNSLSLHALVFGMAGLLDDANPSRDDFTWQRMRQEFDFLCVKFQITRPTHPVWTTGSVRPGNSPHRRLAHLAELLRDQFEFRRHLLAVKSLDEARLLFDVSIPEYWRTHTDFGRSTDSRLSQNTRTTLDLLVINVAVPIIYAFADRMDDEERRQFAIDLLNEMPAERNGIISFFNGVGIKTRCAFDSQAVIELRKEYCAKRKCLFCRVGHRMLASKAVISSHQ